MAALFGYSDSDDYEALRERENLSLLKNTSEISKRDSDRCAFTLFLITVTWNEVNF